MSARRNPSQSAKVRIPGAPVHLWVVVVALLAGGLVVLAALLGARPGADRTIDVLPVVGDAIEETLRRPAVSAFLAVLLLVLLVGAIRGARLRWLASRPGPVDVAELKVAGTLADGLSERLSLRFRWRLADLHLAMPGPQPGIAPATDFVDLIGSATRDSRNVFATVAGLLRVAWPSQAYQVQATLVEDPDHGCGVSVQVVMLPATTTPPTTCWAASWEIAIDRAANHAAAFILPRTRVGRQPPWTAWHGYVLPPALLDAYERAAVYTHERRYDEALREYYRSLELDPKSLDVRLRIGFIQEKLGLALDALMTYQAMCDMTCECSMAGAPRATRRIMHAARRRSQAIAAYRRAVLLGSAEGVSKDWCAPRSEGGRRDAQRRAGRARLRPTLMELCKHKYAETTAHARRVALDALLAEDAQIEQRRELLSEVLQVTAREALRRLEHALPRDLTVGDQSSLTSAAVAVSERCVELRLWSTRRALDGDGRPPALPTLRAWREQAGMGRRAPWSECYSAASLFALGLGAHLEAGDGALDPEADAFAEAAVGELKAAINGADSGYVASRRAWLVSEDPDLEALRSHPRFQRFEATYFPSSSPTVLRPRGAHRWEVVEYVHRLVAACAAHQEELWHGRLKAALTGDGADITTWRPDEVSTWALLSEVASNCEHWQTRLKLVERLELWSARTASDAALGYPDYASIEPQGRPLDRAIADARRALADVHGLCRREQRALARQAARGGVARRPAPRADGREGRRRSARFARERILAWQAVGDSLVDVNPQAVPGPQVDRPAPARDGNGRVRGGGAERHASASPAGRGMAAWTPRSIFGSVVRYSWGEPRAVGSLNPSAPGPPPGGT